MPGMVYCPIGVVLHSLTNASHNCMLLKLRYDTELDETAVGYALVKSAQ